MSKKMENGINANSIIELIDKMKNCSRYVGYSAVLKEWFDCYTDQKRNRVDVYYTYAYYQIYGFLWGLEASGFITSECRLYLVTNLIHLGSYCGDDDGNEYYVDFCGARHYTRDEG